MVQPQWATELIGAVASLEGRSNIPKVKWIQRNRKYTSGVYYRGYKRYTMTFSNRGTVRRAKNFGNTITICLGELDGPQVLIHELSHWLNPKKGHSKKFWIKCFTLLQHFNLLNEDYKKREFAYMKKAEYTFNSMNV